MAEGGKSGTPVTILRDGALRAEGLRFGDVIAYDWGFAQHGRAVVQRSFLLLDDGVTINQPVGFPDGQRGWWYCDLMAVADEGRLVRCDDLWIDVIVGPPDHPYRVLDLDEYADALAAGDLDPADAADGLRRAQRFLDRRLNRRHDPTRTWPDFPPRAVTALLTTPLPRHWAYL